MAITGTGIPTQEWKERIDAEERVKAFRKFQDRLTDDGVVPRCPRLRLRRYGKVVELSYGILLGILMGELALLFVFLIVNRVFHLEL